MPIEIKHNNELLAIIIPDNFNKQGVHFFTDSSFSQQLAYMNHHKGTLISPHTHNPVKREIVYTQEVLFIKKGVLRVDFYTRDEQYLESKLLKAGDTILLASGGHGFEVIEEVEMIEVKQGPFSGEQDKTRFDGVNPNKIILDS